MVCNKDEAIRAKEIAENKMMNNDFEGARKIALKAKKLFPELDNISHLLAVCDVHCSSQKKINGTVNDLYGILHVEKLADDATIKKQYKRLALVLHPDKNHFPGAEAAFKLICEAYMILSDKGKRYLHDAKCRESAKPTVSKPQNYQGNQDSYGGMQFGAQSKNFNVPTSNGQPSFWTLCPLCRIKYEYYRVGVNKTIKCPKCIKLFTAYDLGARQSTQPTQSGHAGMQNVNPGFSSGRPTSSQEEEVGKQKKAKVDPQKAEKSFSHFANQPPQSTKTGDAIRVKEIAENKMMNNDFEGARKIALKAKKLFPELDNISHLLAVCDVHCSSQKKINGTVNDLYGILHVEKLADDATLKKQYKRLALVLHPDKNHFPGAEAAFKLICEAYMILSDKGKRYLHDAKCRESAKPTVSKPQNYQGNQNSHGGMQFGAQSKNFNVPTSNGQPSFWTRCPFCRIKYEYYRVVVNKTIKCPKCLKLFTAYDLGARQSTQSTQSGHAGMQNVNPGFSTGRPTSSQEEEVGKQKKAKVDPQKAKVGGGAGSKKVKNGNLNAKTGKQGVSTKENGGNAIGVSDSNGGNVEGPKRSCKRVHVSNGEETLDDFTPEKRSRLRKLSSDVKGKQKEQKKVPAEEEAKGVNEPKANAHAEGSMQKDKNDESGHCKPNSDSEDDAEPLYVAVPDLEFSNFDRDKEEDCFAVDQVWAVYDTVDGMPRFYAQVKKVYSSGFKLRITWLEADPENHLEKLWAEEGLPAASGRFRRGDSDETKDRLMFSHRVSYQKGSKRFSFVIYPKKGEIWALFKDWDIKWSSDPESHKKFKFEIVEVLSEFDNDNGVLVAFMVKVEGFVSLFQKTSRARLAEHRIPSSELFRFSHHIPSLKLTGNERADVPVGSFELDTASLPDDLDQFYCTNKVKVKPEKVCAQNSASCPQSPEGKVNDFVGEKLNLRRSPIGLKGNCEQSNGVGNKSNIATPSKGNNPSCLDEDVNTKSPELSSRVGGKESKIIIHDFNLDKQKQKFEEGQIWAICGSENGNLRCYAQIKKIEGSPLRLHVDSLKLCHDAIRPNACGLYKAYRGGRKTIQPDSFLYLVKAEVNGKNRFNIYPREEEIWVLYKKKDFNCTFVDENAGECDIVEVVQNSCDMIRVLFLSRVAGNKSVFTRGLERVVEIPLAESDRFIGRVPAFLLTEELDGHLRGCWELDLTEFSGLLTA